MIEISIINNDVEDIGNYDNNPRIDVISLLKLKPDRLIIKGFYFSGVEHTLICEGIEISMKYCHINFLDTTFYKEEKVKKSTNIKKVSRFELMDI